MSRRSRYFAQPRPIIVNYFAQDSLLPFQFVETTVNGQLKTTNTLSSFANYKQKEDDTIRLFLTMMFISAFQWSPSTVTDTRTLTDATEEEEGKGDEIQPEDNTPKA